VLKNRKLHCPEKGATRFVRIFQIILHPISYFFGMLHRNGPSQACRWVIKYFSCLLGNAWSNLDHIVVTAAIRQWRRRLSACVRAGGGHFEHYF